MIPRDILVYLERSGVPFDRRPHTRAISAQELAASIHFSGHRVAKSVIVQADDRTFIAVLPAAELLDEARFAEAVGAREVHLVDEAQFASLFPDCEVGAEPPFGGLYGLPVVMDSALPQEGSIVLRAGSHEEALELSAEDFRNLEQPILAAISRPFVGQPHAVAPEMHLTP